MESDFSNVEKLKTDFEEAVRERDMLLSEKDQLSTGVSDLSAEIEKLKAKVSEVDSSNSEIAAELVSAKDSKLSLESKLSSQKAYYEKELEDAKYAIYNQHVAGFDKTVPQIQYLNPEVDISEADVNKELKDGALVPIEMEEGEDNNEDAPIN